MKVHGSCHCGQIRYEADVDPANVGICHCSDCQVLSGSAWRVSVTTAISDFVLLSGEPKTYVKTADSGNRRAHGFCGECGSPIFARAPVDPPTITLRVGGLDRRADLPPKRQIWCDSALPWSSDLSGVTKVARQ